MSTPAVVAIDGAAGSGKSTLARGLARRLGIPYVNTGSMYRALAAAALRNGVAVDDPDGLLELVRSLSFRVVDGDPPSLEIEGYPANALVAPEVEAIVSAVSRHPGVRTAMRAAQRSLGLRGHVVMEGRDIGSVVFPDAPVKLFLTADPAVRAERRVRERATDEASTAAALRARDDADDRTVPLSAPAGADVLDTGALSIEEALEEALRLVLVRAPWMPQETAS